ncbi:MAG: response regulator transcription factor [Ahniella sp.]|nr:response regulator transcription factor [Ahniella sp.]
MENDQRIGTPVRIAMVEDKPLLRLGVRRVIEQAGDWIWAWEADSLRAARAHEINPCDVLLLDLGLPDGNGLDLIEEFSARKVSVIVFTVLGDEQSVLAAIELGAAGYLLKDASVDEMRLAISQVLAGGAPLDPAVAGHLLRKIRRNEAAASSASSAEHALMNLTAREREVLMALARGFSYDETATMLEISKHTVNHHVKQIYAKLAVTSRSQAVFEAVQAGWLRQ